MNTSTELNMEQLNRQFAEMRNTIHSINAEIAGIRGEMVHVSETVKELINTLKIAVYVSVASFLSALSLMCLCVLAVSGRNMSLSHGTSKLQIE